MNKTVEKAYEINKKADSFNIEIPDLEKVKIKEIELI